MRQIYEKVKSHVGQGGLKTYALNQDHIELFFGSVRTRLGSNDNPTVLQFRSAYKKLLTYVQLEEAPDGSNCLGTLEKVVVLGVNTKRSLNYINEMQEVLFFIHTNILVQKVQYILTPIYNNSC